MMAGRKAHPPTAALERLRAARALLAREGIADVHVRLAGHQDEIVAVSGPPALALRLRALAPDLKAFGFRYVALELDERPADTASET